MSGYQILHFFLKEIPPKVFNKAKKRVLEDTSVSKTKVFARPNYLKVFDTSIFFRN
jgi:hypothetical protein